ncbi:MAG: CPBP family glutamic-type intramembrane protease [Oscillospiraceae bacterium]|nr:CPBP family glutamic-type intramembrane protease [Oscillospiraceae bacterium]
MRITVSKHPILWSIVTVVVFLIALWLPAILLAYFGPDFFVTNGDYLYQGTTECATSLIGIGFVALLGYGWIWNERGKGLGKGFLCAGYFILVSLYSLVIYIADIALMDSAEFNPLWQIVVYVLTVLLIGLAEETFFRGIVANLFLDKYGNDPAGVWCATICSGMVFGLMHLSNLMSSDTVGVLVQVVAACAMGMALTAIYYRCRNIWVLILVHAFVDFCGAFYSGFIAGGSLSSTISSYEPYQCISALPYIVVTIVLLRPRKMREIIVLHRLSGVEDTSVGVVIPEENLKSSPKSRKSCIIAIILAVVILLGLYGAAVYASDYSNSISYEYSGEWDGEAYFGTDAMTFTTLHTAEYTFTISNLPSTNSASMTLIVTDSSGETVYSETFEGRTSAVRSIELQEGETYTVSINYDYSKVGDLAEGERDYMTSITVEYIE